MSLARPPPQAQTFTLGSAAEREVQDIVATALRKARVLVATIREYMDVYRNPAGWLHAFSAFRLPSPLAGSARDQRRAGSARETDAREARDLLMRIAERAGCGPEAVDQLLRILPRAESHARSGCGAKAAWGRASAEFPELMGARALVTCLLCLRSSTGNRERMFRVYRELRTAQRARLADATVDDLLVGTQAPPGAAMQSAVRAASAGNQTGDTKPPLIRYLTKLVSWHNTRHGGRERAPVPTAGRKRRRDASAERDPATRAQQRTLAGAPCSEGAFAKRRAIAIDDAMAAGQETREEQRRRSSFGEVSRAASTEPVAVSAAVATKVRKRARDAKAAHEEADARAAMQRGRCHAKPLAAFTGRQGPSDGAASAPPGIALVKVAAKDAFAKLRKHNFKVSHDPIDFIDQVLRSRVRSPNRGHLVLASAVAHNDFAVAARLLAVLLGTYLADPADFLRRGSKCGRYFVPRYNLPGPPLRVAVSAAVSINAPSVPGILQRIATLPGSNLQYLSEKKLCKDFSKAIEKKEKLPWKHRRLMCEQAERKNASKKLQPLYANAADFLHACEASVLPDALCPGLR